MVKSTDPAKKLEAAQAYFRGLGIEGWEETNKVLGGGQATILVVRRADGARGAFRFSTKSDEKALERFSREIKILSGYEHPNILRILDHSKDTTQPWYISELGDPFDAYWKWRRRQLVDDPEQMVSSAVEVVRQLADGLAPLHGQGVVHRDIKPKNIIINGNVPGRERPVLIDFGLAHVEDEPRLSDVHETVGNVRFSPDVAMYRMDNVPPWLDVHNLGQVFMWMTWVHPDKDWQRAVDWRWVNYDERISDSSALSIKALTALCSEQTVSPKNAGELITLLDGLFPRTSSTSPALINISRIEEGRRRGLAASGLAAAADARIIEATFPIVAKTYLALRQGLHHLFDDYRAAGVYVSEDSEEVAIDAFRLHLLKRDGPNLVWPTGKWLIGESIGKSFSFRTEIEALAPSGRSELPAGGGQLPSDWSDLYLFRLYTGRPQKSGTFPGNVAVLTINEQGSLLLRDSINGEATAVSIKDVVEMVKEWIQDRDVWEALHTFNQWRHLSLLITALAGLLGAATAAACTTG